MPCLACWRFVPVSDCTGPPLAGPPWLRFVPASLPGQRRIAPGRYNVRLTRQPGLAANPRSSALNGIP